jgi:hypothetical protein
VLRSPTESPTPSPSESPETTERAEPGPTEESEPPPPRPPAAATDPQFGTCAEAIDAGYGPYYCGQDPEYDWYRDGDGDGVVCET